MLSPSQRTIVHAIFPTFQTSTCQSSQILEISMAKIVHFTRKPTELKSMNSDEALISWCPDRPSRMSRSCSLSSQVHGMRYALIPFLSVSLRYSIIDGQYWSCNHLHFMVDFSAIPSWLIYLGFHSWPMIIIHSLWCTYLNFNWWLVFFSWSIPKGQLVDGWAIHLKILKLETFPPQIIRDGLKKSNKSEQNH